MYSRYYSPTCEQIFQSSFFYKRKKLNLDVLSSGRTKNNGKDVELKIVRDAIAEIAANMNDFTVLSETVQKPKI